ncbi:MAG: caspase family protein [Arcobacteraceae bacterium]|nr:caspase family protein [Arcobacteraceae bacterium]
MLKIKYKLLTILCLSSLVNSEMVHIEGGTTLDTETKLLWQDNIEVKTVKKNWQDAMDYCQNLKLAELHDWKLPDINTLVALYPKKSGLQFNVGAKYYWSSSTDAYESSYAKVGELNYGSKFQIRNKYYDDYILVRCVRDSKFDTLIFSSFMERLKMVNSTQKSIILNATHGNESALFLVKKDGKNYFGTIESLACELFINQKPNYAKKPFEAIQKLTQEFMNPRKPVDITSRIPKEIVKPTLPKEITKPILPTMPVLVKGEFETKAMFEERVVQTANERQFQINKIQEQYRQDVEARNQTIETLSAEYKEKVKERNQQLALLQKEYDDDILAIAQEQKMKKENPAEYIDIFNKISFLAVMKSVDIKNASYDAETETMYVTVKATNADFEKKASFKVPLADAKEFKENLDKQKIEMAFDYKNSGFVLNNIAIQNNMSTTEPKTYVATLTTSDFKPETVKVALKDTKVDFKAPQGVKLALQNEEFKLSLQNPNLTDKYQVQALGYGDSNKAKGIKYNNDLIPMIKNLKAEKVDSKKWLFVVAVENYDEADAVTYAKNSAEDFVKVAQKRLGIQERNTYSLIDDKATSGSIKDRLDMMLKNVKDGDSVYFYYSGHGIPNPNDGEAYILPKDKIVDYVTREKEFMVRNIYKQLSDSQASKVVAFMDSCFSGNTDGISNIKGVAATRVKTKKVEFDKDKMVVLTAGTANQFSNMYKEKGHRLFSYFLTKAMIERPNLDVDSIYKSISVDVKDESFKMGDLKVQEPQMEGNNKIEL